MTKKKKKKVSLIYKITGVTFVGVAIIITLICVVFITAFRAAAYREVETLVTENIRHTRDNADAQLRERLLLLEYTGLGALPMMTAEVVDIDELTSYFQFMTGTMEDVELLFACSPNLWNGPGGFIAFGDGWRPPDDYDNRTRGWWIDAMEANGRPAFTDPYIDMITGDLVVTISQLVFDENGNPAAVMGQDITMGALDTMANELAVISGMQSFFIHRSGRYVTNPDSTLIMERDFFIFFCLEAIRDQVIDRSFFRTEGDLVISSEPMNTAEWTLVSVIPVASVFDTYANVVMMRAILIAGICLLVLMVALTLTIRIIIRPILIITNDLRDIAEGEGDLTCVITIKSKDEIGELAHYFNGTLEKIKSLIFNIKRSFRIELFQLFYEKINVVIHCFFCK
jgi:methyl-accepting chemotaxis protein